MSDYLFSETPLNYPDGQQNVGALPDAIVSTGFIPAIAGARGQPLPAQWLNWLFQKVFRLINRDRVSNFSGTGLFSIPNSMIRFESFDRDDVNKYLVAIGYKGDAGVVHSLKVISSATLTLGTPTISGNQPVLGGSANTVTRGSSRQFGDI